VGAVEERDDTGIKPVFCMGFMQGVIGGHANALTELISQACVTVFG